MKLNEFKHSKKVKIDEVDTSSLFGNYGSAALRTGVKSLFGKSTLSTQDQIAKDQFVKKFASKAATGLQDAIQSGWVAPGSVSTQPSPNPAVNPNVDTAVDPKVDPNANTKLDPKLDPNANTIIAKKGAVKSPEQTKKELEQKLAAAQIANKTPEQIRQEKQAAATNVAQKQMSTNPVLPNQAPTAGKNVSPTPAQTRQQKLDTAAKAAQDQMAPFSKLPTDQNAVQAGNIRQQKQSTATQTAQDQMANNGTFSKLPADQFAKSAANVRQQQQSTATTNAQGQMTPKVDEPTTKTPEQIRQEKQAAATQAAQGQMAGNVTTSTDTVKPDNTVQMPKKKKINPGKNAFGQMAQNLGKAAESTRFDKLNFLFESIIAEADEAETEGVPKKSISQWIVDFFKKFMKGEDITSDPTIMANVIALAKELEKNYKDDKGKTTIPKLANLAWSATHSPGEKSTSKPTPPDEPPTPNGSVNPPKTPPSEPNQKAKTAYQEIQELLKGLTPTNKQKILNTLQKELTVPAEKEPTITVGKQKRSKKTVDPADAQILAAAKKQGKI